MCEEPGHWGRRDSTRRHVTLHKMTPQFGPLYKAMEGNLMETTAEGWGQCHGLFWLAWRGAGLRAGLHSSLIVAAARRGWGLGWYDAWEGWMGSLGLESCFCLSLALGSQAGHWCSWPSERSSLWRAQCRLSPLWSHY